MFPSVDPSGFLRSVPRFLLSARKRPHVNAGLEPMRRIKNAVGGRKRIEG